MTQLTVDRETILQTVQQWPLAEQIALVQEVLDALRLKVAERPGADQNRDVREQALVEPPLVPPNSAGLAGLLATDQPPPTDEEVARWLEERRMEKYGS